MSVIQHYVACAKRWEHGWELHVDGVGVTQVRTLDNARQQVCDLVETMTGQAVEDWQVTITLDLHGVEAEIEATRLAIVEAQHVQASAAARSRRLVAQLRGEGLSVTDIAALLEVSRGRVSQLARPR